MPEPRVDLDFAAYVKRQKEHGPAPATATEARPIPYAFVDDVRVTRALGRVKPVELAAAATVRMWKSLKKNELLGMCIRVSERQFPRFYRLGKQASDVLGIAMPQIYVAPSLASLNAHTFGTNDDAFIVVNSAMADYMTDEEILFVIGHECGHIQNNHVVYGTALHYLRTAAMLLLQWVAAPAVVALNSWSRYAEITCDRAGLLVVKDSKIATRVFLKLAVGSRSLFDEIDVDEYLDQLGDAREGAGRFAELLATHPYVPKRIAALRVFEKTEMFQKAVGRSGGLTMDECDREVDELIRIR
ncbi:MAG: M48 family metallopeptidase [Deltaproteobacteria bacterium]|nr:M48 family metallopeptidase [Deltaproteobacteria bacterium]